MSKEYGLFYEWYANDLIESTAADSGQYDADKYLDRFCGIIDNYRSEDILTIYVGVTEANIFSNSNNYLFSLGRIRGKSPGSILSYHMMQADVLEEDYAYRPRLAERLAKEMVPASLKVLGIPRSTDPRCPYSYANGVGRLDEKTLTLSRPTKEALESVGL